MNAQIPEAFAELFEPHRFKIFYGGRGGAKSRSFASVLLITAWQRPCRILCAREVQNSIRDSVKRLLDDEIARLGLEGFYTSTDMEIRGANGSLFIFTGLRSNPERVKSYEALTHCWIEEAETVSQKSLDLLIPTMRQEGSEIWMSFNPNRVNSPVWENFVLGTPPPDSVVKKVGWRDNPWFPAVLKAEMEHCKRTDPDKFDHVWEGNPVLVSSGSYYGKALQLAEEQDRIGVVPCDNNLLVNTAWDLGVSDSTAIWFFQFLPVGPTSEWRFIDYYEASGEGLAHYARVLTEKGYNYGTHIAPHDIAVRELGSGKSRIETARTLGINFKVCPQQSVMDGIEASRQVIGSAWFDREKCKQGLQCLWGYQREWDDVRSCFKDAPLHDWSSHGADAFRYAAVGFKKEFMPGRSAPVRSDYDVLNYGLAGSDYE